VSQIVADLLQRVRRRIGDWDNWAQHVAACDENGLECDPFSDRACSWCLDAAIWVASHNDWERCEAIILLNRLARSRSLVKWNDRANRSHQTVLKLLDRGIAEASPTWEKEAANA
jgi:hypothetical protein